MKHVTFENKLDFEKNLLSVASNYYLLLDGARFENIHAFLYMKEDHPAYYPLYRDTYYSSAMEVSPCLVHVTDTSTSLLSWYLAEGADENKALLMTSDWPLELLAKHLQQFLEAKLPNLQIVLFRFYDPVVFDALADLDKHPQLIPLTEPFQSIYWQAGGMLKGLIRSQNYEGTHDA